jgi:hypothetical protein
MVQDLYAPVGATSKSLVGFFALSASYRRFRTRNVRALVAIILAFTLMFRLSTIGDLFPAGFTVFADWAVDVVMAAGYRALIVAAAFGGILLGIRVLLGRELRVFGRREELEVGAE